MQAGWLGTPRNRTSTLRLQLGLMPYLFLTSALGIWRGQIWPKGPGSCLSSSGLPISRSISERCVTLGSEIPYMFEGLFQPTHLLVILGVALFVLGPKKLPEMGKGLGEGIRGFRAALKSEEEKPKAE
jgi:sec-independent protein translocase protein TatA